MCVCVCVCVCLNLLCFYQIFEKLKSEKDNMPSKALNERFSFFDTLLELAAHSPAVSVSQSAPSSSSSAYTAPSAAVSHAASAQRDAERDTRAAPRALPQLQHSASSSSHGTHPVAALSLNAFSQVPLSLSQPVQSFEVPPQRASALQP